MKSSKILLLANINIFKRNQIEAICQKQSITPITISSSDFDTKLGVLCQIKGFADKKTPSIKPGGDLSPSPKAQFNEEMLIFSGFTNQDLDEFLNAYKASSIPPVKLKAIVTLSNVFWTLYDLYKELVTESKVLN